MTSLLFIPVRKTRLVAGRVFLRSLFSSQKLHKLKQLPQIHAPLWGRGFLPARGQRHSQSGAEGAGQLFGQKPAHTADILLHPFSPLLLPHRLGQPQSALQRVGGGRGLLPVSSRLASVPLRHGSVHPVSLLQPFFFILCPGKKLCAKGNALDLAAPFAPKAHRLKGGFDNKGGGCT